MALGDQRRFVAGAPSKAAMHVAVEPLLESSQSRSLTTKVMLATSGMGLMAHGASVKLRSDPGVSGVVAVGSGAAVVDVVSGPVPGALAGDASVATGLAELVGELSAVVIEVVAVRVVREEQAVIARTATRNELRRPHRFVIRAQSSPQPVQLQTNVTELESTAVSRSHCSHADSRWMQRL